MTSTTASMHIECVHELRFRSLRQQGAAMVFPCDATGKVDLNALSDRARNDYLFARAVAGRDFAFPVVAAI